MRLPSRDIVSAIRETYPKGTRVELGSMDDVQAPPVGTKGTVLWVDDIGTVHVKWDNGSTLGAAYGEDRIFKLPPEENN